MRVAQRQPLDGRQARMSRGLNADELRVRLSEAIARYDYHRREGDDLGNLNRPDIALEHIRLAAEAAEEAERLADQITALGRPANRSTGASHWVTEPTR